MTSTADCLQSLVNRVPYIRFWVEKRENKGRFKVGITAACAKCHGELRDVHSYTVVTWQTASMPAPAFDYYHGQCAPAHGSGWGDARPGERIVAPTDVKVGDILLEYSVQFDAFNVVRVTKTDWHNEPETLKGTKFYGIFVSPMNYNEVRQGGDTVMCFWDHALTMTTELYRIKAIKAVPAK